MRKIYGDVTIKVVMAVEEGTPIDDVIHSLEVSYKAGFATLLDAQVESYHITDSK